MIQPFFFGPKEKCLYGCYDAPRGEARTTGVLLCYPAAPEYFTAHRGFRQLAARLSQKGFPVLRFDYFGSGDSFGEPAETSFAQMRRDVAEAVSELRRRSRCSSIALVGRGIGASLVRSGPVEGAEISRAVLWDPLGADEEPGLRERLPPAANVLIVETARGGRGETMAEAYRGQGAKTDYVFLEAPASTDDGVDRIAVPAKAIGAIVSWMARESG